MNKDTILTQISPLDIYKKYLGVKNIDNSKNISSPFSKDANPSFRIYPNGTFKCYSTGKQGDCFQFVADILNLNCKQNFNSILEHIAQHFSIINDRSHTDHFQWTAKPYEKHHIDYWMKWNISKDFLKKYQVFALDKFEYFNHNENKIKKHKIFPNITAFAYALNNTAEIYIPKQEKNKKFILNKTNKKDIFGLSQLHNENQFVIIVAGKKDCIILNAKGFPSISFRSENHYITKEQIQQIKQKTKQIFICYDNDIAGINFTKQILERFPEINSINLPGNFNDVADFFLKKNKEDFTKLINQSKKTNPIDTSGNTIFHITEKYLNQHYQFRYNEISLEIEGCKKGQNNFKQINENSLYIELNKAGIKCSINNLIAILKSNFVEHYNPLKNYFEKLPEWDKKDHIAELCNYLKTPDLKQLTYHFKKWLVRAVKCVFHEDYFNKQAFILVHRGQSSGKSTFCRFICPPALSSYIAEDISNDKDARILLCKNFIINLDELAVLSRKEVNSLKSYFSKTVINERLPYDRKNTILPRVCSFIGSTNMTTFLNDETGSVRWLCFELSGQIDFNYSKKINIDKLWAQAFSLYQNKNFNPELSIKDMEENEARNEKFKVLSPEQELISKYFKVPTKNDPDHKISFMTPTEIQMKLQISYIKISSVGVGKAMQALGFERIKEKKRQVYGYKLIKLFKDTIFDLDQ